MIDKVNHVDEAVSVARIWNASFGTLKDELSDLPDRERLFAGLVGLLGFTCYLWPLWVKSMTTETMKNSCDYSMLDPSEWKEPAFATYFKPINHRVAWFLMVGDRLQDGQVSYTALNHKAVVGSLSSLDDAGKIVTMGNAPLVLKPLIGRKIRDGESPVELPICDCERIQEMLPEWFFALHQATPYVRRACHCLGSEDATVYGLETIRTGYEQFAASVWTHLISMESLSLESPQKKNWFGHRFGGDRMPESFRGVLLLRGDHWALWKAIMKYERW